MTSLVKKPIKRPSLSFRGLTAQKSIGANDFLFFKQDNSSLGPP